MNKLQKRDLIYKEFLLKNLLVEYKEKQQKGIENKIKAARFPWIKTLEQFYFDFQPNIDKKVIINLSTFAFINKIENIVLLCHPVVGKSHLILFHECASFIFLLP